MTLSMINSSSKNGSSSSSLVSSSSISSSSPCPTLSLTSASVGEIFREAGSAFQQLGELTQSLHNQNEAASTSSKWTEKELTFFRSTIRRFSADLLTLTTHMRQKTRQQMKISLKRKAYEEAGVPANKAQAFAAQTVKANDDAVQSTPLRHADTEVSPLRLGDAKESSLLERIQEDKSLGEVEDMKMEPKTASNDAPTQAFPTSPSPSPFPDEASSTTNHREKEEDAAGAEGEEEEVATALNALNSDHVEDDNVVGDDDTLEDGELREDEEPGSSSGDNAALADNVHDVQKPPNT